MRRVNLVYELLYLVGVRPWEQAGVTPELRELVEGPGAPPPGRALDIGCGTGGPTVYLATRGWEVTGVDVVARALRRARARAAAAGVAPRFVHADVSRLADAPSVVGGYDLLFDSGCYHGLSDAQRAAYGEAVGRLAAPGAALLLFALTPGGAARPRSFRGASDEELQARFERDWEFVWKRSLAEPSVFRSAGQFWHLLRRRAHVMRRGAEKMGQRSNPTEEVEKLYTARLKTYRAFIALFRSRDGIRALLRSSELLRSGLRVLDAGAGFGTATFALLDALRQRGMKPHVIDAFDLTPAMLEQFQVELNARGVTQVRLEQANVLTLGDQLPPSWNDYDFIVCASMLEYLTREDLSQGLSALRARLVQNGTLLAVVTRKNWMTRVLIEWWWRAARYTRQELQEAFAAAGFRDVVFIKFPLQYFWLNTSNHVVVARREE